MGIGDWGLGPIPIPNPQSPNHLLKTDFTIIKESLTIIIYK